jgi:hypothetical protein
MDTTVAGSAVSRRRDDAGDLTDGSQSAATLNTTPSCASLKIPSVL